MELTAKHTGAKHRERIDDEKENVFNEVLLPADFDRHVFQLARDLIASIFLLPADFDEHAFQLARDLIASIFLVACGVAIHFGVLLPTDFDERAFQLDRDLIASIFLVACGVAIHFVHTNASLLYAQQVNQPRVLNLTRLVMLDLIDGDWLQLQLEVTWYYNYEGKEMKGRERKDEPR